MSPLPRVPVTLPVIALLLALHGAVRAGPMPAAEADAKATPSLPSLAPEPAASASTGSALAVEIITEAGAGATAAEAPRTPRRDAPHTPPQTPAQLARNQAPADDDPWGVRETAKAAVHWVKDAVPWLRSDDDARDAGRAVAPDQADWSASPLEGGAQRGARPGTAHLPTANAATTDPLTTVGYGDATPRPKYASAEPNIVRVVIETIREVLEHPMTWLVLALLVIGGIVVKKIDRRPTK